MQIRFHNRVERVHTDVVAGAALQPSLVVFSTAVGFFEVAPAFKRQKFIDHLNNLIGDTSVVSMVNDRLYALNEIIDSETSSKMIKEYQEEQKKITSEIETLKNLKQEEESTIENNKLLKEKVNEFLEFKELNSLIVHSLISRIEVGYRDNPRTIKIYYKFIDDSISN